MSTSLGIPDDYSNRKYLRVVEDIIKRCAERKIPVMVHQQTIETSTKVIKLGARFVLHSSDGRMLQRIIQQEMNQLRKIAGATAKATKDTVETVWVGLAPKVAQVIILKIEERIGSSVRD